MSEHDYCPTTRCVNCGFHVCKKSKDNVFEQLQAELTTAKEENRWILVGERLPDKVKHYAVTDGREWWRELWCFVDHSGAKGWEDNPDCITHYRDVTLPEGE